MRSDLRRAAARGWLAGLTGLVLAMAACASAPAGRSADRAATPASSPHGDETAANQEWNALVAAAQREGTVAVLGPPTPELRRRAPEAFQQRFGITLEYVGQASGDYGPRLASERSAGVYSADVVVAGANTMYEVLAGSGQIENGVMGMLAPLRPALILPEVLDPSNYRTGKLLFMDPAEQYVLRTANYTSNDVAINTDYVKPGELQTWQDLLKPEYRGKIVAYDPTIPGAGISATVYKYERLGPEYVKRLFVDQEVVFTRDHRQTADMLARGSRPIALHLQEQAVGDLQEQGFPVTALAHLEGLAPTVTGGFSYIGLVDHAPHPNAAKLFVNWMTSRAGQQVWQDAQLQASTRNDLDESRYPAWFKASVPDPGVQYFDNQNWEFVLDTTPRVVPELRQLLGTR
ncbi:MAG TPA: extracellular solute-binding protein [Chloroflexota bacterium]|nr:extracellular solute-binding protein [Chloroflexota bacterium]